MSDRYQQFTQSPPGRFITKRLGMPQPVPLRRYEPGQQLLDGPALVGAAPGGRLLRPVAEVLKATGSEAYVTPQDDPRAAIAQRALEGFTRSMGKEIGQKGATAQLVYVAPGAEDNIESTLRFLLSAKSAFVDAQVIRIGAGKSEQPPDWERPLQGKIALVT